MTPHWYALITLPQRESAARQWLDRRLGVYSFFPVKAERRHVRGRWIERQSRYLPGYLFARFPAEPNWYELLQSPFVHNAIRGSDGYPGRLHPDSLTAIKAMATVDDEIEHRWHLAARPRRGDRVRVKQGAFAGWDGLEVVEVVAGNVRLSLRLLGRDLELPIEGVEKLA